MPKTVNLVDKDKKASTCNEDSRISVTYTCNLIVAESYDVVVCGGGPAGVMAALAAATQGASVAVIERLNCFGGLATSGLVAPISEFNKNGRRIINGLSWQTIERLAEMGGADITWRSGNVPFDPEYYKLLLQNTLASAGVKMYLECRFVDCICKDNRITHVICGGRSGNFAIGGKCFVDATGDALLANSAGVPMQAETEDCQPATLCFRLGGVDTDRLENLRLSEPGVKYYNKRIKTILESLEPKVPIFGGPWFCWALRPGVVNVNMTRATVNINDPQDFSRVVCKLRSDAVLFSELLKKHVEEFRNSWLMETASLVGCRDGRRIIGAHTLTGSELLSGVRPADAVAASAHPVDIHSGKDSSQRVVFLECEGYIPYRCLYNPHYPNLLVAGRCISADHEAFASTRVQAPCMATGEAAGYAAAFVSGHGVSAADVDTVFLQKLLSRKS